MIEISNLHFSYSDNEPVLNNINASFDDDGSISAIIGESGSGKTTLLKCLGRFIVPQSGKIIVKGNEIHSIDEKAFRKMVGIVFQHLYLFPHLTVMGNLTLAPEKVLKIPLKAAQEKGFTILKRLGLDHLAKSYPAQLSGGQAQRVAIARALVLDPDYLLLDEPTSALDINTTRDFGNWLVHLQERTKFIIVTHDLPFVHDIATHGILIKNGSVVVEGDIGEITDAFTDVVSGVSSARA